MPPISIEQERISLSTNCLSRSIIVVSAIPLNLESLTITEAGTNHIFAGGRYLLSLLSPEQIPPHIRQDHSQGACVVEDLVAPPGVEEVGDDAEAPLEEGLAARGGRGDVPKARFQEFVRFLILGELERNARSEQAAGEPSHRFRKAQHAEFVGIAPEAIPVQRRILADEQGPVAQQR